MGDVNGDGCPDLVSVGDHGSPFINTQQHGVTLWLGRLRRGTGPSCRSATSATEAIALGDANWDGLMDVAYGVHHNYSGFRSRGSATGGRPRRRNR